MCIEHNLMIRIISVFLRNKFPNSFQGRLANSSEDPKRPSSNKDYCFVSDFRDSSFLSFLSVFSKLIDNSCVKNRKEFSLAYIFQLHQISDCEVGIFYRALCMCIEHNLMIRIISVFLRDKFPNSFQGRLANSSEDPKRPSSDKDYRFVQDFRNLSFLSFLSVPDGGKI